MSSSVKLRDHLAAIAVYVFLGLLFFNEVVFQTQWFGEDFFTQNFPNRNFAAVEISRGSFPLWNPYLFSGMPFLADVQTAVLYPFNLLLSLLVNSGGLSYALFEYQVIFHFILCGYFMFLFLRSLDLDSYSALLGGIVFAFSGFFVNHAHHSNLIHSAIWLPAVFYCCRRGFMGNPDWIWGCPVLWAVSLFGGHPQITFLIICASVAYYLYLTVTMRGQVELKKSLYRLAFIMVLFVLLSLVQTLPTMEFLRHTSREALGFAGATKDSLPPRALWTLFMADLFLPSYESWQYWEFRCYAGVAVLMAGLLGVLVCPRAKTVFFQGLALLALVLALGENTVIYKTFFDLVPGFDFFRVPARFIFVFLFAVSVLAAHGFSVLFGKEQGAFGKRLALVAGLFLLAIPVLAVLFADTAELWPHLFKYLAVGALLMSVFFVTLKYKKLPGIKLVIMVLVVADLFYFRGSFNQMRLTADEMRRNLYENPIAMTLKGQEEGTRFLVKNGFPLYSNMGLVYRMSNTSGYNPFRLKEYGKLNLDKPGIANLLGTKFRDVKFLEIPGGDLKGQGVLKEQREFISNADALPRAFFVHRSKFDPSFDLQSVVDKGEFAPLETVYLEKEFPDVKGDVSESVITRYQNTGDEILIGLKNDTRGFLFVSEIYYPGWKVSVNGEEKEVLRANGVFRAVRVEAPSAGGSPNRIKFTFRPLSVTLGGLVSAATFSLMILFFVFKFIVKHRDESEEAEQGKSA